MNFFGHATVASWCSQNPRFVLGSMLPDFATMIRARVPRVSHEALEAGVDFHHATDDVFHDIEAFRELERSARRELAERGLRRGSALGVAHVATEILLDATLARSAEARSAYIAALDEGSPMSEHIHWAEGEGSERFVALMDALVARGVSGEPAPAELVAQRVGRALSGRPRLALALGEEKRVAQWVATFAPKVHASSDAIMTVLRESLA